MRLNNFRVSGSILTGLFPVDVPRGRGDKAVQFLQCPPPKICDGQKIVQNFWWFFTTFDFDRAPSRSGITSELATGTEPRTPDGRARVRLRSSIRVTEHHLLHHSKKVLLQTVFKKTGENLSLKQPHENHAKIHIRELSSELSSKNQQLFGHRQSLHQS